MSPAKSIRVLILLLILAPLAFLAFVERDHRPDWKRTLVVGIYPLADIDHPSVHEWIDQLSLADFQPVEQWLAEQAGNHDLALDQPFEFRLGSPLQQAPPTPPPVGHTLARLRWAATLRWWAWRFDDQGLNADIIVVARYHDSEPAARSLRSIAMPNPRLALIKQIAGQDQQARNHVVLAHELLHTVGASDLYHPASGQPTYPAGYVEPDREPRYPQPAAELMAMAWPLAPNQSIEPSQLQQTRIGPRTAREIGW